VAFQRKKPAAIGLKTPYAGFIVPALATSIDKVPSRERWIHEIKFDGYGVQVHLANNGVKVFTRRGFDWIVMVAFDLLYLNGYDLRKLPLVERKALLKKNIAGRTSSLAKASRSMAARCSSTPAKLALRASSQRFEIAAIRPDVLTTGSKRHVPKARRQSTSKNRVRCPGSGGLMIRSRCLAVASCSPLNVPASTSPSFRHPSTPRQSGKRRWKP
jgi:hypothetical protein